MPERGPGLARFTFFFLLLAGLTIPAAAKTVWIDTDVSIGSPIREADDGFALILAFHSPEIRIAGVSTSYGNAALSYVDLVAHDLARRFGDSANLSASNVYAGARSAGDLGHPSVASEAIAAALNRRRLIYVALGPLTNLATALQLHPHLRHRIDQVIIVGGVAVGEELRFGPGKSFHIHDANIFKDPKAADMVLRSGIPVVLAPIAVGGNLTIDRQDSRALKMSGPAGEYLSEKSHWWLSFWIDIVKSPGAPLFDALGVIAAVKPELLQMEHRYAVLDRHRALTVTQTPNEGVYPVLYTAGFARSTKTLVIQRLMSR